MVQVPVLPPFIDGDILRAQHLNDLSDGIELLNARRPMFFGRQRAEVTTIPVGVMTTIKIDTVEADIENGFNPSDGTWICQTSGFYLVEGGVAMDPAIDNGGNIMLAASLQVNGAETGSAIQPVATGGFTTAVNVNSAFDLVAGDIVSICGKHVNSVADRTTDITDNEQSYLAVIAVALT